jgi:hypothetical protein
VAYKARRAKKEKLKRATNWLMELPFTSHDRDALGAIVGSSSMLWDLGSQITLNYDKPERLIMAALYSAGSVIFEARPDARLGEAVTHLAKRLNLDKIPF